MVAASSRKSLDESALARPPTGRPARIICRYLDGNMPRGAAIIPGRAIAEETNGSMSAHPDLLSPSGPHATSDAPRVAAAFRALLPQARSGQKRHSPLALSVVDAGGKHA
jgi:hypothetical protein